MSKNQDLFKGVTKVYHLTLSAFSLFMIIGVLFTIYYNDPNALAFKEDTSIPVVTEQTDRNLIEKGIHVRTGFVDAEGLMLVVNNCTNCHSAKLVTQNRMNEESWNATIKWMQETQGLWDLGDNQEVIVNYLVTNYPVSDKGRRENLTNIKWYDLEN
jgi:hypothetical protein